jgi:hypothetical protein
MPSTVGGLILFVVFLMPGFVYYIQRRKRVELKSESSLIETARLVAISIVTNLTVVGLFALYRWLFPDHAPNVQSLFTMGWRYVQPRPGYLLLWVVILMAASTTIAFGIAQVDIDIKWLAPDIVYTSAWNHYLGEKGVAPDDTTPYVGLTLRNGLQVSGFVSWLSTELDEVADRDLVLAAPIAVFRSGADAAPIDPGYSRLIVSARDIQDMYIAYRKYDPVYRPPTFYSGRQ